MSLNISKRLCNFVEGQILCAQRVCHLTECCAVNSESVVRDRCKPARSGRFQVSCPYRDRPTCCACNQTHRLLPGRNYMPVTFLFMPLRQQMHVTWLMRSNRPDAVNSTSRSCMFCLLRNQIRIALPLTELRYRLLCCCRPERTWSILLIKRSPGTSTRYNQKFPRLQAWVGCEASMACDVHVSAFEGHPKVVLLHMDARMYNNCYMCY